METKEELQAQLAAINTANAAYWSQPTAHDREKERAKEQATELAVLAIDKERRLAAKRSRQGQGGRRRAALCREANTTRYRRMHDLRTSGNTLEQIAEVMNDERGASPSQIGRIVQKPRP